MKIPLSLYIHTPWCLKKCPYCDFNSHTLRGALPEHDYIHRLIEELEKKQALTQKRLFKSVFIGGGTPSLFSGKGYKILFNYLKPFLEESCEITLEANPGTVDEAYFEDYQALGINRLSIGIQSFQDEKLKTLGRIHAGKEALKAVHSAQKSGFQNINLDLMFGLPGQSLEEALSDLKAAIVLNPQHISWYQLTIEPNTAFYHKTPLLPHEDVIWEIQEKGQSLLASNGFLQYEVSAYAKPQYRCQHNLNYWQFGDYLGIGAGAHSKLTDGRKQSINRHWNFKHPDDYLNLQKSFIANEKTVTRREQFFEFMLNNLRRFDPIPFNLITERTFLSPSEIWPLLQQACEQKFLIFNPEENTLETTPLGKHFLNDLIEIFLP